MIKVEEYIENFSSEVRLKLDQIRKLVFEVAPNASESISYGMPAYRTNGKPLVYFAGYKNHIGFYATPSGHEKFKRELAGFKQGKGSVQFPIQRDLPLKLIREIIEFRVQENQR